MGNSMKDRIRELNRWREEDGVQIAALKSDNATLRARIEELEKVHKEAGEAAFVAHMEERNKREAAEARVAELAAALTNIERAESQYRGSHDLYGGDDPRTGALWDQLRRAGDRARQALSDSGAEVVARDKEKP